MNKVVLDANIYVKLFKKEPDSDQALKLVNKLVTEKIQIIEPSVVVNETINTCEYAKNDISEVCDFFRALIDSSIQFIEIDGDLIKRSLEMTLVGHDKSGYSTFSDSLYHAIAIRENALFITSDRRHFEKTRHLGNIELLSQLAI